MQGDRGSEPTYAPTHGDDKSGLYSMPPLCKTLALMWRALDEYRWSQQTPRWMVDNGALRYKKKTSDGLSNYILSIRSSWWVSSQILECCLTCGSPAVNKVGVSCLADSTMKSTKSVPYLALSKEQHFASLTTDYELNSFYLACGSLEDIFCYDDP